MMIHCREKIIARQKIISVLLVFLHLKLIFRMIRVFQNFISSLVYNFFNIISIQIKHAFTFPGDKLSFPLAITIFLSFSSKELIKQRFLIVERF